VGEIEVMSEREEIPRTTQYERDRAQAVHSLDDETRLHADPDESEVVQGAGGDIRRPNAEDRGGDVLGGHSVDDELADRDVLDSPDDADAGPADEGRESA
jgi:hypothetical protein